MYFADSTELLFEKNVRRRRYWIGYTCCCQQQLEKSMTCQIGNRDKLHGHIRDIARAFGFMMTASFRLCVSLSALIEWASASET